jgi:hypothetical protein
MNAPKRISNKKQNDLQNGDSKNLKNEKSNINGVKVNGSSNSNDSNNHQVLK